MSDQQFKHVSYVEQLRLARGLTQTQVEKLSGLNTRTLRRLERDLNYEPSAITVQRLAHAYHVDAARLMDSIRARRKRGGG